VVGAHSLVKGSFPDYCVIAGAPAKIIKRYNEQNKLWISPYLNEEPYIMHFIQIAHIVLQFSFFSGGLVAY